MDQRRLTLVKDRPAEPDPVIVSSIETWKTDPKWQPQDAREVTALAHLRGWVHFGPICPICRG
jgi:hypothetical protein